MKKIIVNNKLYNQKELLKLLNISKSHYNTLKNNVGFEIKHLGDYKLKEIKKELKLSLKKWESARKETKEWLTRFNNKHGLNITTSALKKAINKHNKYRSITKMLDTNKLTYANISKNLNIFKNPDRLLKPRDYFSLRASKFCDNFRWTIETKIGSEVSQAINDYTNEELIDFAMDAFNGRDMREYYVINHEEFYLTLERFNNYLQWRRNLPNYDGNNNKHTFSYWETTVKG